MVIILLVGVVFAQAQSIPNGRIHLIAKNTGNEIILRWMPTTAGVWHLSNKSGYMVERLAFKDSTDFFGASFQLLSQDTIMPWALNDWESIANKASGDQYAAIAAQTIYGKRNKSDVANKSADFIEKAEEFNNLFNMCALASDYSRNAALAAGLRYEDMRIASDKRYIYRVYSLASTPDFPIDTAYVVVDGKDIKKNPKITIDKVIEGERAVILQWNRMLENAYSGWFVERSKDHGRTWAKLNKAPYVDSPLDANDAPDYIVYIDSVDVNYVPYMYRVRGIDAFADLGEPSKPVNGMGRDRQPPAAPTDIEAEQKKPGEMLIKWKYKDEVGDLKGFLVSRRNQVDGIETALTKKMLPKNTRSFVDDSYDPLHNNWYLIYAIDTAGNAMVGMPEYGTIRDSIPPAAPTGLQGSIDTNGIVHLTWDLGSERDILGYSVFYSHAADHVFANRINHPIADTTFQDTINIHVLSEKIFYKVVAYDMARNASAFSEMIMLKKPDVIPPEAALFTDYKVTKDGIRLKWALSTSKDIKRHYLYRQEKGNPAWKLIYRSENKGSYDQYVDQSTVPGKKYRYKIVAEDDDGLQTVSDYILTLKAIDYSLPVAVKKLTLSTDKQKKKVLVKWTYPKSGDFRFVLYRATDGGSFQVVKPLASNTLQYVDTKVKSNRAYEYMIVVAYAGGKKSGFSPIEKIKIL